MHRRRKVLSMGGGGGGKVKNTGGARGPTFELGGWIIGGRGRAMLALLKNYWGAWPPASPLPPSSYAHDMKHVLGGWLSLLTPLLHSKTKACKAYRVSR